MGSECLKVEAQSLDDSSGQGETAGCWGPRLLFRSDGNQSRRMSPTAGANSLSDEARPAWDILRAPWHWSSSDGGKSSMGPTGEAVDLLAEAVPSLPPDENSPTRSGSLLCPPWTVFSSVGNGHLNY